MTNERVEDFARRLDELTGVDVWSVVAGRGAGSVISLQLGEKVRRAAPLRNPSLTAEQREFDGEFEILVECVWRLDSDSEIVCGCWDDNREGGPMLTGLEQLVGTRVSGIRPSRPGLDLTIGFEERLWLRIFCDQVSEVDAGNNYSVHFPDLVYVVGTRSRLGEQRRASSSVRSE